MTMAVLRLDELARKMDGRILQGSPTRSFRGFTIDSRLTRSGDLFFALAGKRNGHDFINQAVENGARGAVVSEDISRPNGGFALIHVRDTALALHELARQVLLDHPVKVIGITGSVGKTTTKEFTAALLGTRFSVLKSEKNFNNHLGLSLSLLKLEKKHQVAVLEMGMSAPGEIRVLTLIAPPDISVITNVHPVHLQFFKSFDEIASAKKEILDGTKPSGTAVLNGDDPLVRKIAESWKGERVLFGRTAACDIQASRIKRRGAEGMSFELNYGGEKADIHIPFIYESFIDDLLGAAAVCYAMSLPFESVARKAASLKPVAMRGTLFRTGRNVEVLDDSYNSNPKALETALRSLGHLPAKRKIAVLGDMLELGKQETAYHVAAGRMVAAEKWDVLIAVGPLAKHMAEGAAAAGMPPSRIFSFAGSAEAAGSIAALVEDGDFVLIKGSRGMKMETIVCSLKSEGKE